jgi:predicted porin
MNQTRALGLAVALLALPLAAQAEDKVSYNFVDAAYLVVDIDGLSKDADGFGLRGSVELTDNIFLFASYVDLSAKVFGFNVDEQDYAVGVGYDWSMSDTMSLYGKVAWVRAEGDAAGFSVDEDGFSLGVGLRAFVLDPLELEGAITYADLGDFGDSTTLGLAARYYFTKQFAVGVEAGLSDDATSYGVGVRFQW